MQSAATTIKHAISNTPSAYWEKLCRSRAGADPACEGSRFPGLTWRQVDEIITTRTWEPYTHVSVKEPAIAFIAPNVPNLEMGVTKLGDVPEDAVLVFSDPKDTGKVELIWKDASAHARPKIDFIVMLVGPTEGDDDLCVWSFFPGDPIKPSTVPALDRHAQIVTKERAAELGIEWVKIGQTQTEKNLEGSKSVLEALEE